MKKNSEQKYNSSVWQNFYILRGENIFGKLIKHASCRLQNDLPQNIQSNAWIIQIILYKVEHEENQDNTLFVKVQ